MTTTAVAGGTASNANDQPGYREGNHAGRPRDGVTRASWHLGETTGWQSITPSLGSLSSPGWLHHHKLSLSVLPSTGVNNPTIVTSVFGRQFFDSARKDFAPGTEFGPGRTPVARSVADAVRVVWATATCPRASPTSNGRGNSSASRQEIDPHLEAAAIQRRVYRAGGPALFFARVKGTPFPMVSNLFGTLDRTRFLFRDTLDARAQTRRAEDRPGEPAPPAVALPERARSSRGACGRSSSAPARS